MRYQKMDYFARHCTTISDDNIPYSHYYKPPLYLFLRLFGAASIQEFVNFPSFSTVELHFGAASIQERLIIARIR